MTFTRLFQRCLHIPYTHVENSADYATERIGSTLYLYFEASNGREDWKHNLSFPAKPYRHMDGGVWFAHRGFLKVWKTLEGYLEKEISDTSVHAIVTVGYSHGAALALLCYEYAWFHRPDLRESLEGYGFGCPRVIWGSHARKADRRWEHFLVIRNLDDLVTHLPPALFGFSHVGKLLEIGAYGRYSMTDAHRPENILTELEHMEQSVRPLASPIPYIPPISLL